MADEEGEELRVLPISRRPGRKVSAQKKLLGGQTTQVHVSLTRQQAETFYALGAGEWLRDMLLDEMLAEEGNADPNARWLRMAYYHGWVERGLTHQQAMTWRDRIPKGIDIADILIFHAPKGTPQEEIDRVVREHRAKQRLDELANRLPEPPRRAPVPAPYTAPASTAATAPAGSTASAPASLGSPGSPGLLEEEEEDPGL